MVIPDIDAVIQEALRNVRSIEGVRDAILTLLSRWRNEYPDQEIRYVIGIITSDGPEHQGRNIQRLTRLTEHIRQREGGIVFSATSVWSDDVFERIRAPELPKEAWIQFWRDLLRSGHIAGIFKTRRWDASSGARDEVETATALGLSISDEYVDVEL